MSKKNSGGTVASYYETRWRIFEHWWHAGETLGIHYAYYNEQTKNFIDAIYRMNDFIGGLLGLDDKKPLKILDAGCGVGGTSIYLAKKHPTVHFTGITITPGQVVLAKKFIKERDTQNVEVMLGDYHHTAFPDNYFDGVFAIESVSYSENIELFIKEMSRVLKPGGVLVVLDGFRTEASMNPIVKRFYEHFLRGRGYQQLTLSSLASYRALLETHGFAKITMDDISSHVARSQIRGIIIGIPFFVFSQLKRIITLGFYKPANNFQEYAMSVSVYTPFIALNKVTGYYATTARREAPDMNDSEREYRLSCLKKYGRNSLSYLALSQDVLSFRGSWDGFIAYQKFLHAVTILGDPVVSEESLSNALHDLKETFSSKKIPMSLFCCTDNAVKALKQEGFKGVYVGREAVVDLQKFDLSGKKHASIRSSVHHAERNGLTVEEYKFSSERSLTIENEMKVLSKEWVHLHGMTELTFAFGHVDFEHYPEIRYFICKQGGKVVGFVSYYPIYGSKSYYLDLTRRGLSSPRSTIDYLIVESFKILRDEGAEKIYIGFAPLSFIEDSQMNSRLVRNLFILFKPFFQFFYPAKSEFFFKDKFATDWEPNYVYYYPRMSVRLLLSLIHTIYEGGIGALILHKTKSLMKSPAS